VDQIRLQRATAPHLVSLGGTLIEFIRRIFDCQRCHGRRTSRRWTEWSTSRRRTESQRQWSTRGAGFVITQNMAAHGNCCLLVPTALWMGRQGQWMGAEPWGQELWTRTRAGEAEAEAEAEAQSASESETESPTRAIHPQRQRHFMLIKCVDIEQLRVMLSYT